MVDRWERYLFEQHSRETMRRWARKLSIFRYVRAYGGHANDGDSLDAAFLYESEEQLAGFFRSLELEPVVYPAEPPQPVPGTPYSRDDFAAFPSIIPGTRWIGQPGHCVVFGVETFVWCGKDRITLAVHSGFEVTDEHVESAARLEPHLRELPLNRIDPPVDNKHCVCPKHYPEFFA